MRGPYKKKTHCRKGHEMIDSNRLQDGRCRVCSNARYEKKGRTIIPISDKFWPLVNKAPGQGPKGECWEWTGTQSSKGYGILWSSEEGLQVRAHRVSYLINKGPIPEGLLIRHTCDNPACVNPDHLIPGTVQQNAQDMVDRGRAYKHKVTHCPHGHEYTAENTVMRSNKRQCRTCERSYKKIRDAKRKGFVETQV